MPKSKEKGRTEGPRSSAKTTAERLFHSSLIRNKIRRQQAYQQERQQRNKEKRARREQRRREREQLGDKVNLNSINIIYHRLLEKESGFLKNLNTQAYILSCSCQPWRFFFFHC